MSASMTNIKKPQPKPIPQDLQLKPAKVAVTRLSQKEISQWTSKMAPNTPKAKPGPRIKATSFNQQYKLPETTPARKPRRASSTNILHLPEPIEDSPPPRSTTPSLQLAIQEPKLPKRLILSGPKSRKRRVSSSNIESLKAPPSKVKLITVSPSLTFKPSGIPTTPQLALSSSKSATNPVSSFPNISPRPSPISPAPKPATTTYYVVQPYTATTPVSHTTISTQPFILTSSTTFQQTTSSTKTSRVSTEWQSKVQPSVSVIPVSKKDEGKPTLPKGVSIIPLPLKTVVGVAPQATSTPIAPKSNPRLIVSTTAKTASIKGAAADTATAKASPISVVTSVEDSTPRLVTLAATAKSAPVASTTVPAAAKSLPKPDLLATPTSTPSGAETALKVALPPSVTSSGAVMPGNGSNSPSKMTKIITFTPVAKKPDESQVASISKPALATPSVQPMPRTSMPVRTYQRKSNKDAPVLQKSVSSSPVEEPSPVIAKDSPVVGTSTEKPSNTPATTTAPVKAEKEPASTSDGGEVPLEVPEKESEAEAPPISLPAPELLASPPTIDLTEALREIFEEPEEEVEEVPASEAVTETVEVETTQIDDNSTFLICFPGSEPPELLPGGVPVAEEEVVTIAEVPGTLVVTAEDDTTSGPSNRKEVTEVINMEWEETETEEPTLEEPTLDETEEPTLDETEGTEGAEVMPGENLVVLTEEDCFVDENGVFQCPYCSEQGTITKLGQWNEVVTHCMSIHQKAIQKRAAVHCLEEGCKARFNRVQPFRDHLLTIHKKPATSEYYVFPNMEAFMAWKLEEEDRTGNQFIRASGKRKPTLTGEVRAYFYCKRRHMRKMVPNTGQRKRSSYERSNSCVANMSIAESIVDGKVRLDYCPFHYGHTSNVAHNWLNVKEKTLVLRLIEQGLLPLEIVQKVTSGVIPGTSNRLKLLTGKDIFNVEKWAGIRFLERKHEEDDMSLDMWGAELAAEGTAVVYKPMGVQDEAGLLTPEAFFLVVITETQAEILKKHGPDGLIVVECIRVMSTSEMHLITLLVLDKETNKQAYLGAVGFCNQIGAETIQSFVATIFSKVGALHPKTVLSEDPQTLAAIWEYVMGQAPLASFIPSWAVECHWDEHMKLIPDHGKQAAVRKYLQVLLEEKEEVAGGSLLTLVRSMLTPFEDCHEFLQYFEDTFGWQVDFWAGWRRPYDIKLHQPFLQLKEALDKIVFRAKKVKRVDKCLYGMIWFVHNKLDDLNENWSEFNLVASNTLVQVQDLATSTNPTGSHPLPLPEVPPSSTPSPSEASSPSPVVPPTTSAGNLRAEKDKNGTSLDLGGKTVHEFACQECDVIVRCLHSHECACKLAQVHAVICKHIHVQMLDKRKPNVVKDHFTVHMSKPGDADVHQPELRALKETVLDTLQQLANVVGELEQLSVLKRVEQDLKQLNDVVANRPKPKIVITIPDKKKKGAKA